MPTLLLGVLITACAVCVRPCAAASKMVWDGKRWVQKSVEMGTSQGELEYIKRLIDQGKHKQAVKESDLFLKNYPGTPACEEAMNLAGQALMDMGKYYDAYHRFEDQIAAYPNGAFFDRALDREYKIGDAFLKGRKRKVLKMFWIHAYEEGVDIMLRISTHAPNSEIAQRSLLRLGDYYFDKKDYSDAIRVYEDFEKQFPRSRRRPYAMFQTAQSFFLSYKGINWDETPLVDARKKYEVFAMAYPKLAKDKGIPEIIRKIEEARAHKVYHTAEFYRRTHKRKAAIFYYRKTVSTFPNSSWAEKARDRLDHLGASVSADTPVILSKPKPKPRTTNLGLTLDNNTNLKPDKNDILPTLPDQPAPTESETKPTAEPTKPGPLDSLGVQTTPDQNPSDETSEPKEAPKAPEKTEDDELAPIRLEDLKKRMKSGSKNPGGEK